MVKCAIYKHSDLSLLGTTEQLDIDASGFYEFDFPGGARPKVTMNTEYVLVAWGNDDPGAENTIAHKWPDEGTDTGHYDKEVYRDCCKSLSIL